MKKKKKNKGEVASFNQNESCGTFSALNEILAEFEKSIDSSRNPCGTPKKDKGTAFGFSKEAMKFITRMVKGEEPGIVIGSNNIDIEHCSMNFETLVLNLFGKNNQEIIERLRDYPEKYTLSQATKTLTGQDMTFLLLRWQDDLIKYLDLKDIITLLHVILEHDLSRGIRKLTVLDVFSFVALSAISVCIDMNKEAWIAHLEKDLYGVN